MIISLNGREFLNLDFTGPVDRTGTLEDGRATFLWANVEIILGNDFIEISDDTPPEKINEVTALIDTVRVSDYAKMRNRVGPLIAELVDKDILQMNAADLRKLLFLLLWQQKAIRPEIDETTGVLTLHLRNPKEWMKRNPDD